MENILIIGAGSWGGAIAGLVKQNNDKYKSLHIYSRSNGFNLSTCKADTAIIAIPVLAFESFFAENAIHLQNIKNFIIASKGFVLQDGKSVSTPNYLRGIFGEDINVCMLSGPNFSSEVEQGLPTITTLASKSNELLQYTANLLTNATFTCQTTSDENGVALLGLCKNAIAISYGLVCGAFENSTNAKSRHLSNIFLQTANFVKQNGGLAETINLSCGIGDIFLSCSDIKSRNVSFGLNFARLCKDGPTEKQKIVELAQNGKTVEGVNSIANIYALGGQQFSCYNLLYNLLFGELTYNQFIEKI